MGNESWKSPRRCHDCLLKGNTNYLWCQKWGKTDKDYQEYKLDCVACGFHEYTTWDGVSLLE